MVTRRADHYTRDGVGFIMELAEMLGHMEMLMVVLFFIAVSPETCFQTELI